MSRARFAGACVQPEWCKLRNQPANAGGQIPAFAANRGITVQLAEMLGTIGIHETEKNLNNKIARGGFSAAFFIQCLTVIGCQTVRLGDD